VDELHLQTAEETELKKLEAKDERKSEARSSGGGPNPLSLGRGEKYLAPKRAEPDWVLVDHIDYLPQPISGIGRPDG
jgi:hypothetical protein